jgi:hypothetical protein
MSSEFWRPLVEETVAKLSHPDVPRAVNFSVSCRGKASAKRAEEAFAAAGFVPTIHPAGGRQTRWVVIGEQQAVLTPEYVVAHAAQFEVLAQTLDDGNFDGYGFSGDEPTPEELAREQQDMEIAIAGQAIYSMLPKGYYLDGPRIQVESGICTVAVMPPDKPKAGRPQLPVLTRVGADPLQVLAEIARAISDGHLATPDKPDDKLD